MPVTLPAMDETMHALTQHLDNLTVRAARSGDQEFMKRLYASSRDDLRQIAADPTFIDSLISMQQNMQTIGYRNTYPDAEYLVLEHCGEAVGRVVVDTGLKEMRVVDISMLPQVRGRGFGTAVLRALQRNAVEKKLPLVLSVHRNNPRARRLYLKLGFQPVSGNDSAEEMMWDHRVLLS